MTGNLLENPFCSFYTNQQLTQQPMQEDIKQALQVLESGGTILYPTDTIWGIGCDATNPEAIEKVFQIKKRDPAKSMIILVDSPGKVERYVDEMPDIAWDLIELADKPLTIIYSDAINLPDNLTNTDGSIGIRVAQDEFCQKLLTRFKRPIVSTSANLSNTTFPRSYSEIDQKIIQSVDYVVKWRQNETKKISPSGIIQLGRSGEVKVIRE